MSRAILSVHDKTGLVDFARGLRALGWSLIASGGTARLLKKHEIEVEQVSQYTQSPEILSGRVKTLHPAIHGGILAREGGSDEAELKALGWESIDLVAVNLYPFERTVADPAATLEQAVENIDIGGVALIRAAAKNFQRVTLVCDPLDYGTVLSELQSGEVCETMRRRLAVKGFSMRYLSQEAPLTLQAHPIHALRYGENPHQTATLYAWEPGAGPLGGKLLQGKALSYNNLLDLDAAWRAVLSYQDATICIVKHLSPCGIASCADLSRAFQAALASDPISAFGSVVACNRPFDLPAAEALGDLFVEAIIAPGFSTEARACLAGRKTCRLVEMPGIEPERRPELRSITGGMILQSVDMGDPPDTSWEVITKRSPDEAEWRALRFAWKACQHVKSNAIVFAAGEATVGIGGGQPNRVDCVHIAAQRAGDRARGAVMASDAFFPFPDSVQVASQAGITAIIQPGGSVRDAESIAAADEAGIAMVLTGVRHFRH
jgi:phosphoribosylaminoimidazolecarboxamide formyltransferase/IMP cyclohydrolase